MTHAERAAAFVSDTERVAQHDRAVWFVRSRRDEAADGVSDWEALRDQAAAIKRHALPRLGELWEQFESRAQTLGVVVHWARDADEHNQIVLDLLRDVGARRVVKSKSMLTEECGLNAFLESSGIEIIDTDLGERIVQLRNEPPSHIVMPAIHLRKEEIGALFAAKLGSPPELTDPTELTRVARRHLRERFFSADAGITGVNFAIAESGGFVVCTNEGNADLGTALPRLHIACVGVEKIIPRTRDLGVFLRLLARSATGQAITAYSSHFHGPSVPEQALHVVIVDNGRSRLRAHPAFREALGCIRCGACLNTCPVYRRSGGHSYATAVPGPIGSVLAPGQDARAHESLPRACSQCGSCSDVCPVRIPLHTQLLSWRAELAEQGLGRRRAFALRWLGRAMTVGWLYRLGGRALRRIGRILPDALVRRLAAPWTRGRELPALPRHDFRSLYAKRRRAG